MRAHDPHIFFSPLFLAVQPVYKMCVNPVNANIFFGGGGGGGYVFCVGFFAYRQVTYLILNVACFCFFLENQKERLDEIDLIICVGGDGTLLYTSSMFQVRSQLK